MQGEESEVTNPPSCRFVQYYEVNLLSINPSFPPQLLFWAEVLCDRGFIDEGLYWAVAKEAAGEISKNIGETSGMECAGKG